MANEKPDRSVNDSYLRDDSGFSTRGFCNVGNHTSDSTDGALRFASIDIDKNESIDMAKLIYVYGPVGTSGTWKWKINGIDEDNTAAFSSYPFGRTLTTASASFDEGAPTGGGSKEIDVKSIVEEITSRGGWSRNNAMGFILEDLVSDTNVYAYANLNNSYLIYRINAEPNFFPTPGTVSAPSFPSASSYGIKFSKPGVDVGTASEDDLLFTTRKKVLKVVSEGTISLASGATGTVNHSLGYQPFCLAYLKDPTQDRMFKLNRMFGPNYDDPVGNKARGFLTSGTTGIEIRNQTGTATTGYYYTFIDELP